MQNDLLGGATFTLHDKIHHSQSSTVNRQAVFILCIFPKYDPHNDIIMPFNYYVREKRGIELLHHCAMITAQVRQHDVCNQLSTILIPNAR